MIMSKFNKSDKINGENAAKMHKQNIDVDESLLPSTSSKCAELARKLLNRGAGDCASNDILNREFSKNSTRRNVDEALVFLLCEKSSQPFETRVIPLVAQTQCVIGRVCSKSRACDTNAFFDCKVISRNQASIWFDGGRFWLKDTQSSNGTFVNGRKLNDEAVQLHTGDVIKFGVTVYENKCSEFHKCIIASVQLHLPKNWQSRERIPTHLGAIEEAGAEVAGAGVDGETTRCNLCEADSVVDERAMATERRVANCAGVTFKNASTNESMRVEMLSIESFIEAIQNNRAEIFEFIAKKDNCLQRINALQNKIRFLRNDITADELQMEQLDWANEKVLHKRTTKAAMRRFGLETQEVKLRIEQVEQKLKTSAHKCDSIRAQIEGKDQAINELSWRLTHIEVDYEEFKTEMRAKVKAINDDFDEKFNDLKGNLEQLNVKRAALKQKLKQLLKTEKQIKHQKPIRDVCAVERPFEVEENLKLIFEKFQQLMQKLKLNEEAQINVEMLKFFDLKKALKEPPAAVELAAAKPQLKEAAEQTIQEEDSIDYKAELEQLQTQIEEHTMEVEFRQDMLEIECDLYRGKCLELQAQNEMLLAKKSEIEQRRKQAAYALALKELRGEYLKELDGKTHALVVVERELRNFKTLLNESQRETEKLANELTRLGEENTKFMQQADCVLPVMAPIFMGLIGMFVYLVLELLH